MKRKWIWTLVVVLGIAAAGLLVFRIWESRPRPCGLRCNNNLRQIEAAKYQAKQAFGLSNGMQVTESQITPYLFNAVLPTCPSGGKYSINAIGDDAQCSLADPSAKGERHYWHSLGNP